jgi:ribonuclease HI
MFTTRNCQHIKNKRSPLHIHKVKAHKCIQGNEEADKLAKQGIEKKKYQ